MRQSEYQQDRGWSDSHESQVKNILAPLMIYLAEIVVASKNKDNKFATDFVVKLKGSDIAVRLRKHSEFPLVDMTIRSWRKNGSKTELAKLREGCATHYFYGKTDKNDIITQWFFVDLNKVRANGLLEKERETTINSDGETAFIIITVEELEEAGCIIDKRIGNAPNEQTSLLNKIETTLTAIDQRKSIPEEDKPIIYLDPDMQAAEDELTQRDLESLLENWCTCLLCKRLFHANTSYSICPLCWSKDRIRAFDQWKSAYNIAQRAYLTTSLTLLDWLTILSECMGRCAYCKLPSHGIFLHMHDGKKGLTRDNVVPMCPSCREHANNGWLLANERVRDYLEKGIPIFEQIDASYGEGFSH